MISLDWSDCVLSLLVTFVGVKKHTRPGEIKVQNKKYIFGHDTKCDIVNSTLLHCFEQYVEICVKFLYSIIKRMISIRLYLIILMLAYINNVTMDTIIFDIIMDILVPGFLFLSSLVNKPIDPSQCHFNPMTVNRKIESMQKVSVKREECVSSHAYSIDTHEEGIHIHRGYYVFACSVFGQIPACKRCGLSLSITLPLLLVSELLTNEFDVVSDSRLMVSDTHSAEIKECISICYP
ncbi:hypothetical protein BDB01DRAFT_835685 [Pilobolus umbonatus]|nr:hypothetical protein BDB01DRAFT_835685 [Pilobolus umbonatus]